MGAFCTVISVSGAIGKCSNFSALREQFKAIWTLLFNTVMANLEINSVHHRERIKKKNKISVLCEQFNIWTLPSMNSWLICVPILYVAASGASGKFSNLTAPYTKNFKLFGYYTFQQSHGTLYIMASEARVKNSNFNAP